MWPVHRTGSAFQLMQVEHGLLVRGVKVGDLHGLMLGRRSSAWQPI
jgi:hypothetical protein